MSCVNDTTPAKRSSYLERIAIVTPIIIIVLIWASYPRIMQFMDKTNVEEKPKIVIPYKIEQQPESTKLGSNFEKIGEKYGTYGDSYGSLNTLFSGLAFAILIISLFMQRKELQAQRQELEAQRNEIKESNNIAEGQRQITEQQANLIRDQILEAQKQNFYNLFFKFLSEKNDKFSQLTIKSQNSNFSDLVADEFFREFSYSFLEILGTRVLVYPQIEGFPDASESQMILFRLKDSYIRKTNKFYVSFEDTLYFEYIVFILDYMNKNSNLVDKNVLVDTFLSYLTFYETICMACYALLRNINLFNYIKQYNLLKNLTTTSLMHQAQKDSLDLLFASKPLFRKKDGKLGCILEIENRL